MRLISFTFAVLITTTLAFGQATTRPGAPSSGPIDNEGGGKLIQQVVEAHGGADAFAAIKTVRVTIDATTAKQSGEMIRTVHTITTVAFPDRLRQEASVTMGGANPATRGSTITVVLPDHAWTVGTGDAVPSIGVQDLPPQSAESYRKSIASNVIRVMQCAANQAYHFAAAAATEKSGEVEAVPLDIAGPDNVKFRWLVDAKSGGIVARIDNNARSTYLEWEMVGGAKLPTHSQSVNAARGEKTDVRIKYEINPTIDAHAFDKPAAPVNPSTQPRNEKP